jgi:hypothetical protein
LSDRVLLAHELSLFGVPVPTLFPGSGDACRCVYPDLAFFGLSLGGNRWGLMSPEPAKPEQVKGEDDKYR